MEEAKRPQGRPRKYPWPGMKVGDSFSIPVGEKIPKSVQDTIHNSAIYYYGEAGHARVRQFLKQGKLYMRAERIK